MTILQKKKLSDINSYMLILFGFSLPLSVAVNNILAGFIFLLWLIERNFKEKWHIIKNNYFVMAIFVFLGLHFVGLIWTTDIAWGLHITKKEIILLLIPIFMTIARKEHIKHYIFAFLLAMSLSEILSYLIFFKVIPPFGSASATDPTPFMSHISYNPFLAFAFYLILHFFFSKDEPLIEKIICAFFILTISANIFITGGRAGQVVYFAMLILFIFQYFRTQKMKAAIFILILVPLVFGVAYHSSNLFKSRVNMAVEHVMDYKHQKMTSVGLRMTFLLNSMQIIKKHPLIGVGTGDFKNEYAKVNEVRTPDSPVTVNPHNMYILELVQLGVLGLMSLLSIFFFQIKDALSSHRIFSSELGMALPILFLIIMLSDSYLLGHYTTMLFIFFSSFLYKKIYYTQWISRCDKAQTLVSSGVYKQYMSSEASLQCSSHLERRRVDDD